MTERESNATMDVKAPIIKQIDWDALSANPAAIDLLRANPDKIDWWWLSANPAVIELLHADSDKTHAICPEKDSTSAAEGKRSSTSAKALMKVIGRIPKKDSMARLPCCLNPDFSYMAHDPVTDHRWEKEHEGLERKEVHTACNMVRMFPVRKPTKEGYLRNMWQCFGFHQRIRHTCAGSVWIALYDPNDDTINMSSDMIFKSPTSFAEAHNKAMGVDTPIGCGWGVCEYDIDGRSHIEKGIARFINEGEWRPMGEIKAPPQLLPMPDNWLVWHGCNWTWG